MALLVSLLQRLLVTYRQTNRHDEIIYSASIASHGKNRGFEPNPPLFSDPVRGNPDEFLLRSLASENYNYGATIWLYLRDPTFNHSGIVLT